MKNLYVFYIDNVWPDECSAWDLTTLDEPPYRAFIDWYTRRYGRD